MQTQNCSFVHVELAGAGLIEQGLTSLPTPYRFYARRFKAATH